MIGAPSRANTILLPGCVCVRIMKPAQAKCFAERPGAARIGAAKPYEWRPLLYITPKATGAPKAVTPMPPHLARIIWPLLARRVPFDLSIFALQDQANEQRRLNRLAASARQMGYQLTPISA